MCSTLFQSLFNFGLLACILISLVALVTPGWKMATHNNNSTETAKEGLLTMECSRGMWETLKEKAMDDTDITEGCGIKWDKLPTYQQAVIALMALGLIGALACFVWSCLTTCLSCCLCCLKSYLLYPVPVVLILAGAFNLIAVGVYGSKHSSFDDMLSGDDLEKAHEGLSEKFGYSFVMAIIGGLGYLACSILMCCLIKMNKILPI